MILASGRGDWPGTVMAAELPGIAADLAEDAAAFLPVLPARGPGSELIARAGALLVDLAVELRPHGWQLTAAAGRDERRSTALLGEDRDVVAEVFAERSGSLLLPLPGPWTLAARLHARGEERLIADPGARRDLLDSYAEGIAAELERLRRLAPRTEIRVQWEEADLTRVLSARLRTASGFATLPRISENEVAGSLDRFAELAPGIVQLGGADPLAWHDGQAARSLLGLLPRGLDLGLPAGRSVAELEQLAPRLESGGRLWLGHREPPASERAALDAILDPWRRIGLPVDWLEQIGIQIGRAPALDGTAARALIAAHPREPRAGIASALRLAAALQDESRS